MTTRAVLLSCALVFSSGLASGPTAIGAEEKAKVARVAADLSGRFRKVAIESARSAIRFEGSAEQFDLTGEAATVDLTFARDMARDAIHLDVKQLLSQVSFQGA